MRIRRHQEVCVGAVSPSSRSRDILRDVARSLGIGVRRTPGSMQIQYKQDGKWVDVDFEVVDQQTAKTGKLILTFTLMARQP